MELTAKQILEGSREKVLEELKEKEDILEQLDFQIAQIEKEDGAA